MIELHAKNQRLIKRQKQLSEKIEEEYAAEVEAMLAKEKEFEVYLQDEDAFRRAQGGVVVMESQLDSLRRQHRAKMAKHLHVINQLQESLWFSRNDTVTIQTVRSQLNQATKAKKADEQEFSKESLRLQSLIKERKNLKSNLLLFDKNWRPKLKTIRDALRAEAEAKIEETRKKDENFFQQNMEYFQELEKSGNLPFDLSLLDSLGSIILASDNSVVFIGDRYVKRMDEVVQGVEVLEIFPEEKTVKAAIYDPGKGRKIKSLSVDLVAKLEKLTEEDLAALNEAATA
jgi:hypothetical protein